MSEQMNIGTKKENGRLISVIIGLILILAILWATNPPAKDALGAYLIFSGVAFFIYRFSSFRNKLIGIRTDNVVPSLGWALLLGGGFWLSTKFIPGFSMGLPLLPGAIGDTFKFVIIILIAPVAEEIFFRGIVLGYLRSLSIFKNKLFLVIIIQAALFSLAHLVAYVTNFYSFPNFTSGMTAFNANISAFLAAFVFGTVVAYFVTRNGIRNMVFAIFFHAILNLIIFTSLVVVFT